MDTLNFALDADTLEIFPKGICEDIRVVFHATSSYHSEFIENHGFIAKHLPFGSDEAGELTDFLKTNAKGSEHIVADIESYVQYRLSKDAPISFAYHSGKCCLWYAAGELKGGQGLYHIRKADQLICSLQGK